VSMVFPMLAGCTGLGGPPEPNARVEDAIKNWKNRGNYRKFAAWEQYPVKNQEHHGGDKTHHQHYP